MEIILDGKKFTSVDRLHEILQIKLDFPDYYGKNLNALWDCLTGDIALPLTIIWKDFDESKKNLGEYADKTLDLLKEAAGELNGLSIKIE